jgi:hypothetical protein
MPNAESVRLRLVGDRRPEFAMQVGLVARRSRGNARTSYHDGDFS